MHKSLKLWLGVGAALCGWAGGAWGLTIVINPDASLAATPAALGAFDRAAAQWESALSDPITVTIEAALIALSDPDVIAQTHEVAFSASYDAVRNLMVADAADEVDDGIVAFLPTAAQFGADLPVGLGLTGSLSATKANLKALGVADLDAMFGASDGSITFNSGFDFDFDSSDGVGPGLIDFETAAAHEIGHLLGFISVVDDVDFAVEQGLTGNVSPKPIDLFRFSTAFAGNPSDAAEFTSFARELVPGDPAVYDDIDAFELALSTGQFNGDGRQTSHWQDDTIHGGAPTGVLDPTLPAGLSIDVQQTDLRALDVIGYDFLVPEPSSLLLIGFGLFGLTFLGRRQD